MANGGRARLVVEQSPWQTLFEGAPDLILSFMSLNQQMQLKREEAALARDFARTQSDLAFSRQMYAGQKEREATIEDQLSESGLLAPETKTQGLPGILSANAEDLAQKTEATESRISQLLNIKSQQKAGIRDVQSLQSRFANIIEDDKDAAAKYMITGGLSIDPETGQPIGTNEWAAILDKLKEESPVEYGRFRDEAYISGILSSLRTVEDATTLRNIDIQYDLAEKQIDAAVSTAREKNFAFAIAQYDEAEKNSGGLIKRFAFWQTLTKERENDGL